MNVRCPQCQKNIEVRPEVERVRFVMLSGKRSGWVDVIYKISTVEHRCRGEEEG